MYLSLAIHLITDAFTYSYPLALLLIKLNPPGPHTKLAQLLFAIWNPMPGEFFNDSVVPLGTAVLLITRHCAVGLLWSAIEVVI
jgi:hypothetical protein